jgi:membrane associated rhomboid family serine protease
VAAADAVRAREEIEAYGQEQAPPPVVTREPPQPGSGRGGVLGYAAILLIAMVVQHQGLFGVNWMEAGRMQVGLVRQGELWRPVTALCLHGDMGHLVGNLVIGGLVGLFAGQLLGSGLAWFSILVAGALGNLLTVFLRPAEHTSIGASTAVFAALGLLAGHAWMQHRETRTSRLTRYAPIIGAMILLSYLGTAGERTDVLAHVAGFACGLLFGAGYGWRGGRPPRRRAQFGLGVGALATLAAAWFWALR